MRNIYIFILSLITFSCGENQTKDESIIISDSTGPTIRPRGDITLSVSRPDEGVMQLRTGPLLVCEALAMTLAHKNPERAITGLKELEGLRKNLLNGEGSL